MKWGKVSDEEIKLKVCPFDSAATAVVLCDYGKVSFNYGTHIVIERHTRIKILDRKAIDRANIVLPYYTENDLERITQVKAQTINFTPQGKMSVHEVASGQIFDAKTDEKWSQKRFSLPAVGEGSIIEYRYTTLSKNFTFLEAWLFQSDIPTVHSEIRALIGQDLDYRLLYQGSRLLKEYNNKPGNRWVLQNLPALVDESYTDNYLNYAEKIRFQLAGYYKKASSISGGIEYVTTMTSWEKLSREMLADDSFSSYLNRHSIASDVIEKLLSPNDDELSKLQKIYIYVQNTLFWDGKTYLFTRKGLPALLESKQGNSAEINLFLTLLLKEAGLEASPALISTRDHGFPQTGYPLLSQFNQQITYVKLGEKDYFLDATDPARPYTLLSRADLNMAAYVLDKDKPRWVEIKTPSNTRQIVAITADLSDINNPGYKLNVVYKGYNAVNERKEFNTQGKDNYVKKRLANSFNEYTIKDFSCGAANTNEEDFSVTYFLTSADHINATDKIIYLNPVLVNNFRESPFKNSLRRLPVEFAYPRSYNYIMNMRIPDGYNVQEVPKPVLLKLPENMGEFRFNIQATGQQIQVVTHVHIKNDYIPVEYYSHLQQFFDLIVAKYGEFIVLQKQ